MTAQTILPANSVTGGYEVDNSCIFDGSSAYMHKTPGSAGNTKLWTWSAWFKKCPTGADLGVFGQYIDANNYFRIKFRDDDRLQVDQYTSGSHVMNLILTQILRDVSAWYHLVVAYDSAQGTASNRAKVYINGSQVTAFDTETYPNQNVVTTLPVDGTPIELGRTTDSQFFNGYFAEVVLIDGTALTPTSFGEFDEDSGIWKPINVSGLTFGTNGFYLDFEASGNLGNDANGGTDLTEVGLAATDQATDTCTNNFCTLNPLTLQDSAYVLSQGNLRISIGGDNERKAVLGTFGLTAGKWYWEVKYISTSGQAFSQIGISDVIQGTEASSENGKMGYFAYDYGYRGEKSSGSGGFKTNNGTYSNYGDAWTTGDIIGVAVDLDNNAIYFSKNGTFQASGAVGDPTSGSSRTNATFNITAASSTGTGAYFPAIGKEDADDPIFEFNFGSPSFAISSGNADGDGHGNFEFAVPSGYFALNTKNLAEYG